MPRGHRWFNTWINDLVLTDSVHDGGKGSDRGRPARLAADQRPFPRRALCQTRSDRWRVMALCRGRASQAILNAPDREATPSIESFWWAFHVFAPSSWRYMFRLTSRSAWSQRIHAWRRKIFSSEAAWCRPTVALIRRLASFWSETGPGPRPQAQAKRRLKCREMFSKSNDVKIYEMISSQRGWGGVGWGGVGWGGVGWGVVGWGGVGCGVVGWGGVRWGSAFSVCNFENNLWKNLGHPADMMKRLLNTSGWLICRDPDGAMGRKY